MDYMNVTLTTPAPRERQVLGKRAVADSLGWQRTGFGDLLRSEIARLCGDSGNREALRTLGQQRVEGDSAAFCRDVLAASGFRPGGDFVDEGIRHVAIFETLSEVSSPSDARLLFLGASETTRAVLIKTRADSSDSTRASMHQVETELLDALPGRADGIINANHCLDHVVSDCLDLVHRWQERL